MSFGSVFLGFFGNPIITGLLGVLIGALLGNHFAVSRDKRREFNSAIKPIRLDAISQFDAMKGEELGHHISRGRVLYIRGAIDEKRCAKIVSAFEEYEQAYKAVLVGVPVTADDPFFKQEKISEKIPEYKRKLKKLISTLELKNRHD
jgi:hypothetical protein